MKRSEAREKVFQTLFQIDYYDNFNEIYENILAESGLKGTQGEYAKKAIEGILENLAEIDKTIEENLSGWTFDRITKPAAALLRLGIYEAFYDENIPEITAIDEAVKLAYNYCEEKEAVFVNGLLNKVYKENNK